MTNSNNAMARKGVTMLWQAVTRARKRVTMVLPAVTMED